MDKYKNFMYIGIFILLISLVSSAGTYAWFTWISPSNTSVTLSIGNLADVTFTSGPDINITNLAPVYNYTDGVSTTFTVRNVNSTDSLLYKVKLEITSIANELKDESFKYTLLKDNKVVKTGNLKDAVNGNTLILNTSSLDKAYSSTYSRTSAYKLYFWIDGNMENNPNMMNKSLIGKIDVGIETNVLTYGDDPSSTSNFLNTSIARQNISTLSFVDNLNIPEGLTTEDVSENKDGSILMWYTDEDGDGNYDVTIGSNDRIYINPTYSGTIFSQLINATSIDLSNIDTSAVSDMSKMFAGDKSLISLDLSNFDTSNVTNMGSQATYTGMFYGCSSLTDINLSSFDTSNVTGMKRMFYNCSSLKSLDLSSFDTSKVTEMDGMFQNCSSLTSLDVSMFDTSSVKEFGDYNEGGMFSYCRSLTSLDVSNFNTSNATGMSHMFRDCSSLTSLDVSNFDTSNVTIMNSMFSGCSSLKSLDLSNFNTSKVSRMNSMFSGCRSLISLDVSNFDISNCERFGKREWCVDSMFQNCSSLTTLDLTSFDMSKVINMDFMFFNCNKLTTIYVSDLWGVSNVTSSNSAFYSCYSLKGAVSFDSGKTDVSMANYTNGYLTYKKR